MYHRQSNHYPLKYSYALFTLGSLERFFQRLFERLQIILFLQRLQRLHSLILIYFYYINQLYTGLGVVNLISFWK